MDNDKARELNNKYGTLLCLNVPEGSSIGIDNKIWTSGPLFKGVKMLPPGVHMFHCTSNSNEYGDSFSVSSSFIWVNEPPIKKDDEDNDDDDDDSQRQIFIKRWNLEDEDFYPDQSITEQEFKSYSEAIKNYEFDKNLAPYPFDGSQIQWNILTSHITKSLLSRILPISNIINGDSCSYDQQKSNPMSRKEKKILDDLDLQLKEFNEKRGTTTTTNSKIKKETTGNWGVPYFSKIPKNPRLVNNESSSNMITNISKWNLDRSECIEFIINKYYKSNEMDLLGEIEFSFVLFIFGMTWSGFQQWKELVTLMLGCDELVEKKPELFLEFFKILKNQLQEAPPDMFESELSNRIFIKPLLKQFIESFYNPETTNLDEMSPIQSQLFKTIIDLKNFVTNRFNWNLNLFNQIELENTNKNTGIKKENKFINKKQQESDDEEDEQKQPLQNNQQNFDDYDSEDDEYKPVLVLDTDMEYL